MKGKNGKRSIAVFVSATNQDLRNHQGEAARRLAELKQSIRGLELFVPDENVSLDVCLRQLSECRLLILLLGASYGRIHPGSGRSVMELEYAHAMKQDVPVLVYLADMSSPAIGIPLNGMDAEHKQELEAFKERLKEAHPVSFFVSVDDLGRKIERDVPEILEKLGIISLQSKNEAQGLAEDVTEEMLRAGAARFERFWLRPKGLAGEIVPMRLRIRKKYSGWSTMDEMIRAIGLEVGDTISTEITIALGLTGGILDEKDDIPLFASGDDADWLLKNAAKPGCLIDCYVRLACCRAPRETDGKPVNAVSLIFVRGIRSVQSQDLILNPKLYAFDTV